MYTTTGYLQKHDDLHVRARDQKERAVDVVMSSPSEDLHGEVVDQKWRLERFKRNPVLLFGHDSRSLPIGKVENVRVEGGVLRGRMIFAPASANPEAEKAWQLVDLGFMSTVSVGFLSHDQKYETRGGIEVRVLTDNELVELSLVPIPANADAMVQQSFTERAGRAPETDAFAFDEDGRGRPQWRVSRPRRSMTSSASRGWLACSTASRATSPR